MILRQPSIKLKAQHGKYNNWIEEKLVQTTMLNVAWVCYIANHSNTRFAMNEI